jgi:hypothetical protein
MRCLGGEQSLDRRSRIHHAMAEESTAKEIQVRGIEPILC